MRLPLAILAAPLLASSAAAEPQADSLPQADLKPEAELALSLQPENCRDTIVMLREERGLPPLELRRENADPNGAEALMILAVDRDIDGCDVLVMASDPSDVRPLPRFEPGDWRVRPAPHRDPYRRQ